MITSALTKHWRPILAILGVSLFAWAPLLTPAYFFNAHDAPHSIFFLVEFDQTLRDGYVWPRWAPDFAFGYGYPLFNLYAPLAFYAAELLHLLGLSALDAIKTTYALATVGAGLAMYGFVRRLFGWQAGAVASVAYMFAPFHLLEIFVRSAYSEFVAMAFFPLVLWAFTELIWEPTFRRVAWAALAYGVLALTHHTSFFAITPLVALYVIYGIVRYGQGAGKRYAVRLVLYSLGAATLGLGLAAIYLVPMLAEMRYVKISQWTAFNYDFQQHFVFFSQLLSPFWGYGYSGPGPDDGMSFQLGVLPLGLAFAATLLAVSHYLRIRRKHLGIGGSNKPDDRGSDSPDSNGPRAGVLTADVLFFAGISIVLIWLMSPAAQPVWQALPFFNLVQFPWRLLGLSALTLAVVAGSLCPLLSTAARRIVPAGTRSAGVAGVEHPAARFPAELALLMLVVVLSTYHYALPQYTPVEDWRQTPAAVIHWDRFSPAERVGMPAQAEQQPTTSPLEEAYLTGQPLSAATILRGDGQVKTIRRGAASSEIWVSAVEPVIVQFYTYDYPGWQVFLDGQGASHYPASPYGLITLEVPAGEHRVQLRMGTTPARLAGGLTSLAALAAIGAGLSGIWRRVTRLL